MVPNVSSDHPISTKDENERVGLTVSINNLTVAFGATIALNNVSLEAVPGRILAIAGENGSGKSTLFNTISGTIRPARGTIEIGGVAYRGLDRDQAANLGIEVVYQELSLFPHLSAATNISIGVEKSRYGFIERKTIRRDIECLLENTGFRDLPLDRPVGELPVRDQQVVEILKCLYRHPRIILFDEPTASLNRRLARQVLHTIRKLREHELTVLFVSHYLDEVYEIADDVAVLRDGNLIGTFPVSGLPKATLIEYMLGEKVRNRPVIARRDSSNAPAAYRKKVQSAVSVIDVTLQAEGSPMNLEIRTGEIIGFAGEVESGAPELAETIVGLRKPVSGRIDVFVGGVKIQSRSAGNRVRSLLEFGRSVPVGYLGPSRREDGLLKGMSVQSNLLFTYEVTNFAGAREEKVARFGFLRKRREKVLADRTISQYGIRTSGSAISVEALSGGNQQKVVLARWLIARPELLVLNNPTVGVDIGAREEIYDMLRAYVAGGGTLVVLSGDPQELVTLCERIVPFYDYQLLGVWDARDASEEKLVRALQLGEFEA